jgi:hydroxymethylpyrimidine/phosphomethylpyrimidine kinase
MVRSRNIAFIIIGFVMIHTVLTIAGSDPSGGAGIQADLKTFSRLKVYGMAAIAALTAQNTAGVDGVMAVPADFMRLQLDAVMRDITPEAVKTGMLANAEIIEAVADLLNKYAIRRVVVDPVLIATSGARLLEPSAIEALRHRLAPAALVITPNIPEAVALSGRDIQNVQDMEEAARRIHALGSKYVLVKGGHLAGEAEDVLFDGHSFTRFAAPRVKTDDVHGTGCVLSAAIAAILARGETVEEAVALGKQFVTEAIRRSLRLGSGHGPCDPVGVE